jgi:hypothetical protein
MSKLTLPVVLGLGLVLGTAAGANAQTVASTVAGPSIASLPPSQSPAGPRANSSNSIPRPGDVSIEARQQIDALGPKAGEAWSLRQTQTIDDQD